MKCWDVPVDRKDVPVEAFLAAFAELVPVDLDPEFAQGSAHEDISGIMVAAPDDMPSEMVARYFREALTAVGSHATAGRPRPYPC